VQTAGVTPKIRTVIPTGAKRSGGTWFAGVIHILKEKPSFARLGRWDILRQAQDRLCPYAGSDRLLARAIPCSV